MRIFLPLLCALCATPVHGIFPGTCQRKEPPAGVLVLFPGSKLVLTCGGHVTVDGVKISTGKNSLKDNSRSKTLSLATTTVVRRTRNSEMSTKSHKQAMGKAVSEGYHSNPTVTVENTDVLQTNTGHTTSPTPHMVHPTISSPETSESNWEAEEMDGKDNYAEQVGESKVTRVMKSRPQWKWNGKIVGNKDEDWRELSLESHGAMLSLSSVRVKDSGRYTCHHRGKERFSLKVTIAVPPMTPTLSCYKRSPSSKLRCDGSFQTTLTPPPDCYLFLGKGHTESFTVLQCSYSSRLSRCWCAVPPNDDELRVFHSAFLCVSSIAGNATSTLLNFSPMSILKPDPPSNITAQPVEGVERWIRVSWRFPTSWKSEGNFYKLKYEIKYRPGMFSSNEQIQPIGSDHSYTISDAMTGVEYLIQVRSKDDREGSWSEWSSAIRASSWKVSTTISSDTSSEILFPFYTEGSGSGDNESDGQELEQPTGPVVSYPLWWITASFALFSAILAAYIYRHKDRFMSRLQILSVVSDRGDPPHPLPSALTAPEEQVLVTVSPLRCKDRQKNKKEEGKKDNMEEDQRQNERTEAMHFNNTSYFFLPR